jgi:hypothetical protein
MFLDRSGFEVFPEPISAEDFRATHHPGVGRDGQSARKTAELKMDAVDDGALVHIGNMLDCMRTRQLPQTDIEQGHRSTSACVLGNVALRSKERLEWDVTRQSLVKGGPAAQKLLSRDYRAPWKLTV